MLLIFQAEEGATQTLSPFFKWFVDPNQYDTPGAAEVALNWVIAAVVIAVLVAALMEASKWILKERASLTRKHWALLKVIGWLLLGWVPAILVIWAIWYFSVDFKMILAIGGFFKGVLFAWAVYSVLMFLADFALPRFRSDYGK